MKRIFSYVFRTELTGHPIFMYASLCTHSAGMYKNNIHVFYLTLLRAIVASRTPGPAWA